MHPNPIFRTDADAHTLALIERRGFGNWVSNGDGLPIIAAAPFSCGWGEDGGLHELNAHIMRANPLAKKLKDGACPCRVIINGPDGYISPDWYGLDNQVPTWNYIDAHVDGEVALQPDKELTEILAQLSATFEARLLPKPEWLMSKVEPEILAKLMRVIVPIRLRVDAVSATWKLSQNKTAEARQSVSQTISSHAATGRTDLGINLDELAAWHEQPPF